VIDSEVNKMTAHQLRRVARDLGLEFKPLKRNELAKKLCASIKKCNGCGYLSVVRKEEGNVK